MQTGCILSFVFERNRLDEFSKARELDFYVIAELLRRRRCGIVTLRRKPFPQLRRLHAGRQFRVEAIDDIFWRGTRR